ncbi:MAG: DUF3179 domain-containing protein [Acidimicrobiia bacterium]|nr:DUF3179 domain-containing protein [Acidimicrobiia bacterium]MYH55978.1 DUF3179 domain-containing protein [Acidimicrobiia bacterium]
MNGSGQACRWVCLVALTVLLLVGCGGGDSSGPDLSEGSEASSPSSTVARTTPGESSESTFLDSSAGTTQPPISDPTTTTSASTESTVTSDRVTTEAETTTTTTLSQEPVTVPDDSRQGLDLMVAYATETWPTDWGNRSIDLSELLLGIGVPDPRDAIPPIDNPIYESLEEAGEWLDPRAPGVLVALGGETRFYALSILHRHEIVNDEIAGIPVAVTYCPLCNTALTFDRRVGDQVLRFGVSGLLRNSDLVMWDDRSVSLWQQVTGEAIVGTATGTFLTPIPTAIVSFGEYSDSYPNGLSMSRDSGLGIPYGFNPYEGYSSRDAPYPFFNGEVDPRYRALDRVVGVTLGGGAKAFPFPVLAEVKVVNDSVGGVPIAVFWGGDTADALDTRVVREGRSVGTGIAYLRQVDGRPLNFIAEGELFRDQETSSTWNLLGEAVDGPLAGTRLEIAVHRNEFWFVWGAFFPDGEVYEIG